MNELMEEEIRKEINTTKKLIKKAINDANGKGISFKIPEIQNHELFLECKGCGAMIPVIGKLESLEKKLKENSIACIYCEQKVFEVIEGKQELEEIDIENHEVILN